MAFPAYVWMHWMVTRQVNILTVFQLISSEITASLSLSHSPCASAKVCLLQFIRCHWFWITQNVFGITFYVYNKIKTMQGTWPRRCLVNTNPARAGFILEHKIVSTERGKPTQRWQCDNGLTGIYFCMWSVFSLISRRLTVWWVKNAQRQGEAHGHATADFRQTFPLTTWEKASMSWT